MNYSMERAGWRECPEKDVIGRWIQMGGEWQRMPSDGALRPQYGLESLTPATQRSSLTRPVHPEHGWDHAPWMWAACTGESMVPTEPGWYWWSGLSREDCEIPWMPIEVYGHADHGLLADGGDDNSERPVWVGQWGGPCTGMPPENFKGEETKR